MIRRIALPTTLAALLALGFSASAQISYGTGAGGAITDAVGDQPDPATTIGFLESDIVLSDTHTIALFDGVLGSNLGPGCIVIAQI